MATLAELQSRITLVRQKERNVILLSGIAKTVLALVLIVLAYFVLDWVFDLPYGMRLMSAAIGTAILLWILNKHLVRELRKIADDDEIALRVESRNPELRNRLISTLQLARTGAAGEYAGSAEMLAALEEETVRMSDPLDFTKIINTEMLVRFGIAALLVVAIKATLIWKFPEYFSALGARLIKADAAYPTKTKILDIKTPLYVPRGEDIPVDVRLDITGDTPGQGLLEFRSVTKKTSVPVELLPVERGRYAGVLAKAVEDVDLYVSIGDAHASPKRIRVLPRPEVDVARSGACVQYNWPGYTHVKNLPAERFGTLSALSGSTASIKFVPTKPLKTARIERADGRTYSLTRQTEKVTEVQDGKNVVQEIEWWSVPDFPIDKSGSYHVVLTDLDGLSNVQPAVEYPIDARPDLPPSIKLIKPRKDVTVTPTAKVNVSFQARDDYGLRLIRLAYRIQAEGQSDSDTKPDYVDRDLTKEPEYKERLPLDLSKTFPWDLSTLKVKSADGVRDIKPGDQITFWFEADDECTANDYLKTNTRKVNDGLPEVENKGPVYPRSVDVKLTIVSREDKAHELEAEVERLSRQIERHRDDQQDLKLKVLKILEEIKKLKEPQ